MLVSARKIAFGLALSFTIGSGGGQALAYDYSAQVVAFVQAAQEGATRVEESCQQIECSSDLISEMNGLRASIGLLNELLGQPTLDTARIRAEVTWASQRIQSICGQLGLQC